MTTEEFVLQLREVVARVSANTIMENLRNPPGRRPEPRVLARAEWFSRLGDSDRAMIEAVVRESVDEAIFGLLCVLDGVRAVDPDGRGVLELLYVDEDERSRLNDPDGELLHDIYNSLSAPT